MLDMCLMWLANLTIVPKSLFIQKSDLFLIWSHLYISVFLTEYSESSHLNASFSPGNAPTSTTFASQDAGSTASSEEDSDEADSSELLLVSLSESLSELLSFNGGPKTTTCPGESKSRSWGIRPKICIILKGHSACLVDWNSRVCMMNLQFISSSSTD